MRVKTTKIGPVAAIMMLALAAPAAAQIWTTMPDAAQALGQLGSELTPELSGKTGELYQAFAGQAQNGAVVVADQKYGPHERNVLDVYQPAVAAENAAPVLVYAPGGGFVRGDKAGASNIGQRFAAAGIVVVTVNYRFAPESQWPSGAEDIAGVLSWIKENIADYGGDPAKVIIAGSSAGAAHVGSYTFGEALQLDDDGVVGAILISVPTANLTDHELDPARDALYFGKSETERASQSLINNLDGRKIPTMLVVGEHDIALAQSSGAQLIAGLYQRDGVLPVHMTAIGHNHFSIVQHIGSPDDAVASAMLDFITGVARSD